MRVLGGDLHSQPTGFIELAQPGHDALPWPAGRAIRFDQRPIRVSSAVLRLKELANKHAAIVPPSSDRTRGNFSLHHVPATIHPPGDHQQTTYVKSRRRKLPENAKLSQNWGS